MPSAQASQRQPNWADIKTKLEGFDSKDLVGLVHDLYEASTANRRFLQARLLRSPSAVEKYRRLVADAVFPDPFSRRRVSLRDATAAITEYRRSTGDMAGTVDLMLTFIEAGTEQAADLGYGDEAYFSALENKVDAVAKSWPALPAEVRTKALGQSGVVTARRTVLIQALLEGTVSYMSPEQRFSDRFNRCRRAAATWAGLGPGGRQHQSQGCISRFPDAVEGC